MKEVLLQFLKTVLQIDREGGERRTRKRLVSGSDRTDRQVRYFVYSSTFAGKFSHSLSSFLFVRSLVRSVEDGCHSERKEEAAGGARQQ